MSIVPVPSRESESIEVPSTNSVAAASCRESHQPVGGDKSGNILPVAWFAGIIARIWPERQRAKMLRFVTGVRSDRTARAWASGEAEPSAFILSLLLRSDAGERVLEAIMSGCTAPWWRELRRARIVTAAFDAARTRVDQQLELALD